MSRLSHSGIAVPTTLANPMTSGSASATCAALVGYPDTLTGPFVVTIDRDTEFEEKVLVSAVVGPVATISQRGYDGTTAQSHSPGATFEHTFSATEADEANDHIQKSTGVHGLGPGDGSFVGTTKSQTMSNKTMDGGNNTFTNIPTSASPDIVALVTAEAVARDAADDAEALARIAGDDAEAAARTAAVAAEATARDAEDDRLSPIGQIIMFGGSTPPSGWLTCDGTPVARATYAALFAVIGTTYGSGDGSTTFNLPDFAARVPAGDAGATPLGTAYGSDTVTLDATNLAPHEHTMTHTHNDDFAIASGGAHTHTTSAADVVAGTAGTNDFEADPPGENRSFEIATISSGGSHTHSLTGSVGAANDSTTDGGTGLNATPVSIVPKSLSVRFLIRAT